MEAEKYQQAIIKYSKKLAQFLRIKQKLELRKFQIIILLEGTNTSQIKSEEIESSLKSLMNIHVRELRILEYCEKGLRYMTGIMDEVQLEIKNNIGFSQRMKARFRFFRKNEDYLNECLSFMLPLFYELRRRIYFLLVTLYKTRNLIQKQQSLLAKINSEINEGKIVAFQIRETNHFRKIKILYANEIELLQRVKENSQSSKLQKSSEELNVAIQKLITIAENKTKKIKFVNKRFGQLKPYPMLAAAQSVFALAPIASPIEAGGAFLIKNYVDSYAIGIACGAIVIAFAELIKYWPTFVIIAKEKLAV